jgi:co-chaperonin GroES (HSP10)
MIARNQNILVKPFPPEESKNVIIPPLFLKKGQTVHRGVVECSDGKIPMGTTIVFQKYAGDQIQFNGQSYVIIKPASIIAIE